MMRAEARGCRAVWRNATAACSPPLRLHGETSRRMMARLDPHTNILRATAAVFGAGLGGADTFTVLPFSIAQGLPKTHCAAHGAQYAAHPAGGVAALAGG